MFSVVVVADLISVSVNKYIKKYIKNNFPSQLGLLVLHVNGPSHPLRVSGHAFHKSGSLGVHA